MTNETSLCLTHFGLPKWEYIIYHIFEPNSHTPSLLHLNPLTQSYAMFHHCAPAHKKKKNTSPLPSWRMFDPATTLLGSPCHLHLLVSILRPFLLNATDGSVSLGPLRPTALTSHFSELAFRVCLNLDFHPWIVYDILDLFQIWHKQFWSWPFPITANREDWL